VARVALYGGAFDPPHVAHLFAVTALLARGDTDEVWLLPTADHVFGKRMTPFEARVSLLRAALAPLASGRVRVCEIEAEREGPSRSYETLELLTSLHPEHVFALALGADNIAERHRWHRFDDLVARWPVIVFGRPGYERALEEVGDASWCRPAVTLPAISSTEIRAALRGGGDPAALRWVPDAIRGQVHYPQAASAPIQILGAGRAARAFATALRGAGHDVRVWSRSPSDHADAVGPLPDLGEAPIWLLCVSDDALRPLAEQCAASVSTPDGHVALHCAGRFGAEVLAPLAAVGVETGSLHPLQSLRGDSAHDRLSGVYCAVEGSAAARTEACRLARAMGARPVTLPAGGKGAYHAAAVLAANFSTVLGAAGVAVLRSLGTDATVARDMLVPLLRGTLEHFATAEGTAALTGPFARGDLDAVTAHVAALNRHAPEWVSVYGALARATAVWLGWPDARCAALAAALQSEA